MYREGLDQSHHINLTETETVADLEKEVIQFSTEWLEDFYSNNTKQNLLDESLVQALDKIGPVHNDDHNHSERNSYLYKLHLFTNELCNFILQKKESADPNEFVLFKKKFRDTFFDESPSIFEALGPVNLLFHQAAIDRYEDLRPLFEDDLIRPIMYDVSHGVGWIEFTIQLIAESQKFNQEQLLELTYLMKRIGLKSITENGIIDESIIEAVTSFYKFVRNQKQFSVAHVLAGISDTELRATYAGALKSNFNLTSNFTEIHEQQEGFRQLILHKSAILKSQIELKPDGKNQTNDLVRIADNALCVLDERGLPQRLALFNEQDLEQGDLVQQAKIDNILLQIDKDDREDKVLFVIDKLTESILQFDKPDIEPEQWLADSVGILNKQDWKSVLAVNAGTNAANKDLQASKEEHFLQLEQGKFAIINNKIQFLKTAVEKANNDQLPSELVGYVTDFANALREGDHEFILQWCNYFNNAPYKNIPALQEILRMCGQVMNEVQNVGEQYHISMQNAYDAYNNTVDSLSLQYQVQEKDDLLRSEEEIVLSKLKQYLENISSKHISAKPIVETKSYHTLLNEIGVNPFGLPLDEETMRMLQFMHEPAYMNVLGQELGVNLTTIPLASQFYFFKMVLSSNQDQFNNLKTVLKAQATQEMRELVVKTFLACAKNESYEEVILNLASNEQYRSVLPKILKKYSEITSTIDGIELMINQMTQSSENNSEAARAMVKNIINKGNKLLVNSLERLDNGNPFSQIESDLTFLNNDLLVFGQLIKATSKLEGVMLENFNDFSTQTISSDNLSEVDRDKIKQLFITNKKKDSTYDNPKDLSAAIEELEESMRPESKTTFHLFTYKNELAVGLNSKQISPDTIYMNGFDARDEVKGVLPVMILDKVIEQYGKQFNIIAEAVAGSPAARWYMQRYGFKPTGKAETVGTVTYIELKRDQILESKSVAVGKA